MLLQNQGLTFYLERDFPSFLLLLRQHIHIQAWSSLAALKRCVGWSPEEDITKEGNKNLPPFLSQDICEKEKCYRVEYFLCISLCYDYINSAALGCLASKPAPKEMLRQDNVGAKRVGSFAPCYLSGLGNHLWASSCINLRNGHGNAAAQCGQKEISQYGLLELPSGVYSEKLNWAPVGPPGDSACGVRGGIDQAEDWKETVAVRQRSVARGRRGGDRITSI